MQKRIPSSSDYVLCEWKGPEVLDFSQRLFSRELRKLSVGEGRLCLFLFPDGKVRHLFWMIKSAQESWLVLQAKEQALSWKADIDSYRFSEAFELGDFKNVSMSWEELATGTEEDGSGSLKSENQFEGEFKSTRFFFDWNSQNSEAEQAGSSSWIKHRVLHLIPEPKIDFAEPRLVFELGLEKYCDPSKGCYIGQEIVERVLSRGGKAPHELVGSVWNAEILPGDAIFQDEKRIGQLSLNSSFSRDDNKYYALALVRKQSTKNSRIFAEKTAAEGQIIG